MRGDLSDDRSDGGSEEAVAQSAGVDVVAGFFGVKAGDIDYSAITSALGTALIHDSFLYENRDLYPELTSGVLRGMEALGNAWLGRELAIRLYMSRDFDTLGQLSTLHAAAMHSLRRMAADDRLVGQLSPLWEERGTRRALEADPAPTCVPGDRRDRDLGG